ncbi:hypothetical protein HKX48_002560 [Thoreauomyces humboldtii]|nr:hypothetical protein HKX48_002560 [Thoreauomyces humboldtii]
MPPKRKPSHREVRKANPLDKKPKRRKIRPTQDEYISPNEDSDDAAEVSDLKSLEEVAANASSSDEDDVQQPTLAGVEADEDEDEEEEGDSFGMDALDEEDLDGKIDDDEDVDDAEADEADEDAVGQDPSKTKSSKLASAIGKILAGDLGLKDENRPILAKQRHLERAIDNEKLEARARKIITAERKQKAEIGHVVPEHTTTDYEKKLRKVATRGVVKLFNAIRVAQKTAEDVRSDGIQKNADAAPLISKNTFLDMIKPPTEKTTVELKATSVVSSKSKVATESSGPSWVDPDFMMKAPKHWDQDDDDEEEADVN